ncbi:MAG: hypothetical protein GY860_13860 [Desulfobacteraceae bacterium]|nr:hypothetical protein [Desulfobacteraceae bacterium]
MQISVHKKLGKAFTHSFVTILGALIFFPLSFPIFAEDPTQGSVLNHMENAINLSADIGKTANNWSQKKQKLLEQMRELEFKNQ